MLRSSISLFPLGTRSISDIRLALTKSFSITPVHVADPKQQSQRSQSTTDQYDAQRFMRRLGQIDEFVCHLYAYGNCASYLQAYCKCKEGRPRRQQKSQTTVWDFLVSATTGSACRLRSEERRVGKEC